MARSFELLYNSTQIENRIAEIAAEISRAYAKSNSDDAIFIWLKEGARTFANSLAKKIDLAVEFYGVKVSSYADMHVSSGAVKIEGDFPDVKNRRVLLIDDILDTALTAKTLIAKLESLGAKEVKTCFLLNKVKKNKGIVKPDFQGFVIDDVYVVGFGLDSAGKFRDLADICIYR